MANVIFSYPNYSDVTTQTTPLLSGGDWETAFPLTNLQDRFLSKVARSSDATTASTKFNVDLISPRDISRVIIPSHNLSRFASARVRASNQPAFSGVTLNASALTGASAIDVYSTGTITEGDTFTLPGDDTIYTATMTLEGSSSLTISPNLSAGHSAGEALTARNGNFTSPVWDSGWFDVWPVITAWGTLPWGSAGLWEGKLAEEERAGYPIPLRAATTPVVARYLLIEIDDTGNDDGYVELARLFVSRGIQPTRNFGFGAEIGWVDPTQAKASLGGAKMYDERDKYRAVSIAIEHLPDDESLGLFLDMMNRLGRSKQLYVELDPDATVHLHRLSFLATLENIQPVGFTSYGRKKVMLQLEEVIA